MEKVQMQLKISTEVMDGLKAEAEKQGISPNILVRMILHKRFGRADAESKSYTFMAKNWREIEAYVEAKRLGTVEVFAGFAMDRYMTQYPPKTTQKCSDEENIEE